MATRRLTIDARGLRFDALAAGPATGELVLLLHGFPQSAACWRQALTTLGDAGFRAVAPNQRGYSRGALPEGAEAYRLQEPAEDAFAIAAALGAGRFHVIGHDWGGAVVWMMAMQRPVELASVTSVSTPHPAALATALRSPVQQARFAYMAVLRTPRVGEGLFQLAGGAAAVRMLTTTGLSEAAARRDVRHLRSIGPTGALNWYRALGPGALRLREDVHVPSLYIWSDGDPAFGRSAAELTEHHVRAPYHYVELQGASHWIPDENWRDIEDVVLEHLQTHRARTRR